MAQISFTIADDKVQRMRAAFAARYGYRAKVFDPATGAEIDNPESRADFARRMIREFVKGVIRDHERREAAEAAANAAGAAVETEIELT
jgi:hypothetical protein